MGGVFAPDCIDSLAHWGGRAGVLAPPVRQAVKDLLAGNAVQSIDGDLELSWQPSKDGRSISLRVAVVGEEVAAELAVRPVDGHEPCTSKDKRVAHPVPACWRTLVGDDDVQWCLFNCVVFSLAFVRTD